MAMAGAGAIAREHAATLDASLGATLVAVCDPDAGRADAVAGPRHIPAYASWEAMLADARTDVLVVCTPPAHHRAPAAAALRAGIHVYVEKPLAHTVADGQAVVEAADRSAALCAVGYQWRSLALLDTARTVLAGDRIELMAGVNYGAVVERPWFLDPAAGGGQILERASHHIDLQRALAGEVRSVTATAAATGLAQDAPAIPDAVSLLLRFAGGAVGTVHCAWTRADAPARYAVDVVSAGAALALELGPDRHALSGAAGGQAVTAEEEGDPLRGSLERFLDAVRAGDPGRVACGPEDALRTLEVALACERSIAERRTVAL